ncbi:MAG TPA: hypothetical protein VLJ79_29845, partial [Candidatus Binatia bacterium]|nr:hypothetical protein [Candidatus Binatia bacterium]
GEYRLPNCLYEWCRELHNSERLCCHGDEALADRCHSYKRRNNLFLPEGNRERQPDLAAKLRWDVQTSGGESDGQSSHLQAG